MTSRPFVIGLTGSIAMGKSTTAGFFVDAGVPVWDADAAVARLYAVGGKAVKPLRAAFPTAISDDKVSKAALKAIISTDSTALQRIEAIVHPLVATDRAQFIAHTDAPVVVVDIPLLFETGAQDQVDCVVVVSTDAKTQRARALAREGMTEVHFDAIRAKQLPDAQKRARADFVIDTHDLETARRQTHDVLDQIRNRQSHA